MPDRFAYDPEHPVPSMGGNVCCSVVPSGPWDQRPVENRDDVLIYTTAPMTRSVEVTGPISMVLYAATSAKDTDWTAKLVDVYPNGYAQNVQSGIVRARYREGTGKPAKPIQPGQVTNTISICGPRARCSCRGIEFAWRFHRAIFPASTGTSTRGKTRARESYSPGGMARSTRLRSNLLEILRRSNQKNSRKESQEAGAGRELKAKRSLH